MTARYQEEAFRQWIAYHVALGEWEEAQLLGWDGVHPPPPSAAEVEAAVRDVGTGVVASHPCTPPRTLTGSPPRGHSARRELDATRAAEDISALFAADEDEAEAEAAVRLQASVRGHQTRRAVWSDGPGWSPQREAAFEAQVLEDAAIINGFSEYLNGCQRLSWVPELSIAVTESGSSELRV